MASPALLAYDDGCGPCSTFKGFVEFLDPRRSIECVPLGRADESGALSVIDPAARYRSFHLVVGGRTASGGEALLLLPALLLPSGAWLFASLETFPGLRRTAWWVYWTLSRLHGKGACIQKSGSAPPANR